MGSCHSRYTKVSLFDRLPVRRFATIFLATAPKRSIWPSCLDCDSTRMGQVSHPPLNLEQLDARELQRKNDQDNDVILTPVRVQVDLVVFTALYTTFYSEAILGCGPMGSDEIIFLLFVVGSNCISLKAPKQSAKYPRRRENTAMKVATSKTCTRCEAPVHYRAMFRCRHTWTPSSSNSSCMVLTVVCRCSI